MEMRLVFLETNSSTCLGPLFRQKRQCSQLKLSPEEKDYVNLLVYTLRQSMCVLIFSLSIIRVYNGIYWRLFKIMVGVFLICIFLVLVTEKFQQKYKRINLWMKSTFSVPSKTEQALLPPAFFSDLMAMAFVPAVLWLLWFCEKILI